MFIPIRIPKIFKWLLLLLPIAEIVAFIWVGKLIGAFPTILLVLVSSLLGFYIVRSQGFVLFSKRVFSEARSPTDLSHMFLTMVAGFLLIIPGFITDAIGLLLLVRPFRMYFGKWLSKHKVIKTPPGKGAILEGEYWPSSHKKDEF